MDEAARDARDEERVVDLEFNGVLQLLGARGEHAVEFLRLGDSAREAVEDKAAEALGAVAWAFQWRPFIPLFAFRVVVKLILDHVDHDVVADEASLIHDLFGLPPECSLLRDLRPEHVSSSLGRISNVVVARWQADRTRWHAQYLSFILGAWVPLPEHR